MTTVIKTKTPITIRFLNREELPIAARIFNDAFTTGEFHARFMPGRHSYPHEYLNFTFHRFRTRFVSPDMHMTVAEDASGTVIGFANWQVVDESPLAAEWRQRIPWWWSIERPLLKLEEYYNHHIVNHCTDFPLIARFIKLRSNIYQGLPPHLHLVILAVAPGQQGKGVGKAMLQWGLDLAERDSLPVVLESSQLGRPVYESVGFKMYRTVNLDHEAEGALEVPVMLWEPSTLKGKILEEDGLGGWRRISQESLDNSL